MINNVEEFEQYFTDELKERSFDITSSNRTLIANELMSIFEKKFAMENIEADVDKPTIIITIGNKYVVKIFHQYHIDQDDNNFIKNGNIRLYYPFVQEYIMARLASGMNRFSGAFFVTPFMLLTSKNNPAMVMSKYKTLVDEVVDMNDESYDFIVWMIIHAIFVMQKFSITHGDLKPPNILLEEITNDTMWNGLVIRKHEKIGIDFNGYVKYFYTRKVKYMPKICDWGLAMCSDPRYRISIDPVGTTIPTTHTHYMDIAFMAITCYSYQPIERKLIAWLMTPTNDYTEIKSKHDLFERYVSEFDDESIVKENVIVQPMDLEIDEFYVLLTRCGTIRITHGHVQTDIYNLDYTSKRFESKTPDDFLKYLIQDGEFETEPRSNSIIVAKIP
jgi:serine/threonine protein kinase